MPLTIVPCETVWGFPMEIQGIISITKHNSKTQVIEMNEMKRNINYCKHLVFICTFGWAIQWVFHIFVFEISIRRSCQV